MNIVVLSLRLAVNVKIQAIMANTLTSINDFLRPYGSKIMLPRSPPIGQNIVLIDAKNENNNQNS